MGASYDSIPDSLVKWLVKQQMFWVATAALTGHVNVSPKSTPDCFHIVHKNKVWYEDLTGSGVETIAHLREPGNGRITILFHAFEGGPKILRLWGTGTVHEFGTPEYDEFIPPEKRKAGSRAAIVIDVHKVATSCGFAIPLYKFQSHRSSLERWCGSLEIFDHSPMSPSEGTTTNGSNSPHPKGLKAWWIAENLKSLDGLPALQLAHQAPAVPSNTFNRNAPPKYGKMVRVAGDVSEDVGAEGASSPNNDELNEASGFECKDKDKGRAEGNTRTNNAKQGRPREVILERGRSENLKVLGAFVLGVFATLVYFKLAEALVAPARYLVNVHI
ncbi:hypothetical protein SCLCIDRAFT_1221558 [Scleroderma citrinum Foug A]|uniref:Uncharacterized protein n=1 Tax=Scleroderma citrinum Foug A TaxID=1036808 RepID=A0A0C3DEY5_9AGAM|nr:hypothetical protein SCLCIDRAFT_1221558 [Scleroderma citrinum Foug A]